MRRYGRWILLGVLGTVFAGCGSHWPGRSEPAFVPDVRTLSDPPQPQGLPPAPAGLDECLKIGAADSPAVRAAFERWKAALEQVPQARTLPDPRFSYDYFISEIETRVGAQRQALAISQTFPWLGKLMAAEGIAADAARAAHQRYQAEKLRLFYRVQEAWYECYYLARAIEITDENYRLVGHLESVARARYRAAAGSHPDVIRAQVELGKLDDRLRSLRRLQPPLAARLNAILGRPSDTPLTIPDTCPDDAAVFDEAQLLADLGKTNPELAAMDAEIDRSRGAVTLARQAYFPDITLMTRWIDTASSTGGRRPSDDGKDALAVGASVNVPIWWESYAAGVRQAQARRRAVQYTKADRANTLAADVLMAAYQVRDTERKIDLYRATLVPKAGQAVRASETAYRAGTGTFSDLVDSQRLWLEFQLAAQRALTDHAQTLARLEMLVGHRLPRRRQPPTSQPTKEN